MKIEKFPITKAYFAMCKRYHAANDAYWSAAERAADTGRKEHRRIAYSLHAALERADARMNRAWNKWLDSGEFDAWSIRKAKLAKRLAAKRKSKGRK